MGSPFCPAKRRRDVLLSLFVKFRQPLGSGGTPDLRVINADPVSCSAQRLASHMEPRWVALVGEERDKETNNAKRLVSRDFSPIDHRERAGCDCSGKRRSG